MRDIRESILADRFMELYKEKRAFLHGSDVDNPIRHQRPRRRKSLTVGAYEVHIAPEGFASIRHTASGEIMHSRTPPYDEARLLYIEQSGLSGRLRLTEGETPETAAPLVIWDVGLGAAANAMAAIRCHEEQAASGPVRPLCIVSFENDLDSLKLALSHIDKFHYLRHSGPSALVEDGEWQSRLHAGLRWVLVRGEFPATLADAPAPPDLIFYDMFSSNSAAELWSLDVFRRIFEACVDGAAELFTYTCSTAIRAGLLGAGFHVAIGRGIGEKKETTIALTAAALDRPGNLQRELLPADWLRRWMRSHAQFPPGLPAGEQESFAHRIRGHAQFRGA
jgi:queuine tRNA-ribosyltransferase